MKSLTSLLVTVPSAAAWLSKNNGVSVNVPLHLRDTQLTSLNARSGDGGEDNARDNFHSAPKRTTDMFEDIMDDDAILFLRAREEGTSIISDNFLTSSAGIQIGMWSEASDICRDREECEQCDIPEDFKLPLTSEPIDVMSFLGIQRAEPLRIEQTDDWA